MQIEGQKLFLVQGRLRYYPYMQDVYEKDATRLVWAASEDEALKKFEAQLSSEDPYSLSVHATADDALEALI